MGNHVIRDRVWDSKKLERCSDEAAAWYPWIFLVADDWGRFEYHPHAIWMCVFRRRPSVTREHVEKWLSEYEREGLLIRYHVHGDLAFWTNFKGRKESERRESDYPDPMSFQDVAEKVKALKDRWKSGAPAATKPRKRRGTSAEEPRSDRVLSEQSRAETERNRNPPDPPEGGSPSEDPVREVFDHWRVVMEHPDAKLTDERRAKVRARLRDYSVPQLLEAIDGCKSSAFHMGANDAKRRHDDLTLICRNGSKVEQFRAMVAPKVHDPPGTRGGLPSEGPWEKRT